VNSEAVGGGRNGEKGGEKVSHEPREIAKKNTREESKNRPEE